MPHIVRERSRLLIPQWRYMEGVDTNLEKYLHREMKARVVFCILGDKEKKT
jgi:hypothetical protein